MDHEIGFELDIVAMIKEKAAGHGLLESDIEKLLSELDASADKIGIEPDSLYMILLDSISGGFACSKEQIIHQIKVMLNNSNTMKCFPV